MNEERAYTRAELAREMSARGYTLILSLPLPGTRGTEYHFFNDEDHEVVLTLSPEGLLGTNTTI